MSDPRSRPRKSEPAPPAAARPGTETKHKQQTRQLPPYKVLLHNDDVNEMGFVVRTIMELTHLSQEEATKRMLEAHQRGLSLLLITHKERAELYAEQFATKGLTVTIEPAQ
jgi:ATP-dependent Clp protease adaptor protein ClpS